MMGHDAAKYAGSLLGGTTSQQFHFADFTLDQSRYRLQRGERVLRLEKRPMELLILLVERRGELVSRDEIGQRLWGKDVFLDVDRSINTAVSKVRVALRDDPDKPRFVETVVGKGYRFAAPVVCGNGDPRPQAHPSPEFTPAVTSPPSPSTENPQSTLLKLLLVGAAVVLVFFTVGLVVVRHHSTRDMRPHVIKSLAVLPLKNLSADPSQQYLADGMTEALIGRLAGIRDLRVISRTSVMRFKDTKESVPEIAKALGVDAIVEGSVIREGGRIRVHAQLIRGATDEHFWSDTYDQELRDVLTLQSEVAQSIAQKVEVTVTGEEQTNLVATRPVSPDVYESYLKGEFGKSNNRVELEERIAHFEDAIRKDPTFAPAYVGLAESYDYLGTIFVGAPPGEVRRKSINYALKAMELDPKAAGAHAVLADVYQRRWQWADAETEYKKALQLKPNDAAIHLGFATWLMCQGRLDEAVAWAHRARELDPLSASGAEIGWILFQARRYDDAIREVRSELEVRPDEAWAHWVLGFVLIVKGQPEEAIPVLERAASISDRNPGSLELLAAAYARAARRTDALRVIRELEHRRERGYVPAGAFINVYIALGDYDQAFASFERAYQEQSTILQFIKVHPYFDPLRGDPRFKDLLRRVGLAKDNHLSLVLDNPLFDCSPVARKFLSGNFAAAAPVVDVQFSIRAAGVAGNYRQIPGQRQPDLSFRHHSTNASNAIRPIPVRSLLRD